MKTCLNCAHMYSRNPCNICLRGGLKEYWKSKGVIDTVLVWIRRLKVGR